MHAFVLAYAIPPLVLIPLTLAFWGLRIFFLTILVITAFAWCKGSMVRWTMLKLTGFTAVLLLLNYLLLDSYGSRLASELLTEVSLFTFCPPVVVLILLLVEKKPT